LGKLLAYRWVWFDDTNKRWFRGRSSRKEWWLELLYMGLITGIAGAISPIAGAIIGALRLVQFWAVTARRLHDLNQTAWIHVGVILSYAIVVYTSVGLEVRDSWLATTFPPSGLFAREVFPVISGLSIFVAILFYGWIGFVKGTDAPNPYGEDAQIEE
jgi:uncharacterized membrane protein YhaH (DUF805 family)